MPDEQPRWVTVAEAAEAAGVGRSTIRAWYRADLPSRLVDGPHGPTREVPLDAVLDRARLGERLAAALSDPAGVAAGPSAAGGTGDAAVLALADALQRAEARADRAEAALRDALVRAARAEARLAALLGSAP